MGKLTEGSHLAVAAALLSAVSLCAPRRALAAISPLEMFHQYPSETLALIGVIIAVFVVLLVVIVRTKTRYAKQLYELANIDELTRMPNFNKFRKDAEKLLLSPKRPAYALMMLNVVKFKDVNDLYGYSAGDEALRQLSRHLWNHLTRGELLARLHSDRFIVLLQCADAEQFERRYRNFLDELAREYFNREIPCRLRLAVGVCFVNKADVDVNTLMDRARYAQNLCYADALRDYVVFDDGLMRKVQLERTLEGDMDAALANGEFRVYYQPKIDSDTNEIEGAEALLRWEHSRFGMLPPSSFIPLFEKNAFILKTDYMVFQEVCHFLAERRAAGTSVFPISCNFSRLHLMNEAFADDLEAQIDQYGLEHSLLAVEITETIAMQDIAMAKAQFERLRAKGFVVSIDDFGSGYSSLGILPMLSFDEIKIDRSLVVNATTSEASRLLLSGIVETIRSLDKRIVCEGVESQTQIDLLKEMGCHTIQGYFYARPMRRAEFMQRY